MTITTKTFNNIRHFLLSVLFLSAISITSTSWAQDYRILVTNDDGVESPLLAALVAELQTLGEVVVSAPRSNQSGSSQASTGGSLRVERILRDGQLFGYGVFGTPTDALRYGLLVLGECRQCLSYVWNCWGRYAGNLFGSSSDRSLSGHEWSGHLGDRKSRRSSGASISG